MRTKIGLAGALAALLLAGGLEAAALAGDKPLPPGHPPVGGARPFAIEPPPPGAGQGDKALTWDVPAGWVAEKPANPMRRAQYRIPGPGGEAQCVVFYFGPGLGGEPRANALRWAGQFRPAGGKTPEEALKTETRRVGGVEVLVVEIEGTYVGMMGGGPPKPGYMLLGAIAKGPDANWFFKLTGPAETVKAQRKAFDALIASLRPGRSGARGRHPA
ncbi:MAG: hypothetical protein D6718_09685 [Acidobacteria bacterium]|nr:MAG: hypothetical protein D6718_09685 [Acidobacteriota bacterium]